MTTERLIRIFAGLFVLVSLALAIPDSPVFVSEWFFVFTAFVGANLLPSCPNNLDCLSKAFAD